MAKGTKKQHYVPQLLLRRFADENERLFVYNMAADKAFPSTVKDTGHQNHFLSVPALDGDDGPGAYYERLFQKYEGPAMGAIRDVEAALASGVLKVVGDTQREALARFIAVQYVRTPAAREQSLQLEELMKRVLAQEIAKRNELDTTDPSIASAIEKFARTDPENEAALHAERMLRPDFIDELAAMFSGHVWLLGVNNTPAPLYVADHPVAVHGHVERPGRGLGPGSYGAEVIVPLASKLQLSLFERKFIQDEIPPLEQLDGSVYAELTPENVEFQRSLQVQAAQQFIYCAADDFGLARSMCERDPGLRDPLRPRIEAVAFGKLERPRRRK